MLTQRSAQMPKLFGGLKDMGRGRGKRVGVGGEGRGGQHLHPQRFGFMNTLRFAWSHSSWAFLPDVSIMQLHLFTNPPPTNGVSGSNCGPLNVQPNKPHG